MKTLNLMLLTTLSAVIIFSTSCTKDNNNPSPISSIDTVLIKDMKAGPVKFDTTNGTRGGLILDSTNQYILFRFSDSTIVPHEDSATTKWDIGFYCSNIFSQKDIILNSSVHGPGKVEGQLLDTAFDMLTEAPVNGYEKDDASKNVFSNFSDYDFSGGTHLILPKDNETLVIHTNDGKYVKMKILSLYKGMPDKADLNYKTSQLGYYSFKYVIQQDGSNNFEN